MNQSTPDVLKYDALYTIMAMGVIVSDSNETIEWVNPFLCQLIDTVPESLVGAPVKSLLNLSKLQPVNYVQRYEVTTDTGKEAWLQCTKTTVQDDNGEIHHVRFVTDISDFQARQSSRVNVNSHVDESRMDEITGSLNRKAILQELDAQVSRSRRYGNCLSVILMECKFTQSLHADKKDAILFSIANSIKANLRWVDQIGVMSPERFLIILPESDIQAAEQAWGKIMAELQEVTMQEGQQYLHTERSITEWQTGEDKETLIQKLEESIQQFKAA